MTSISGVSGTTAQTSTASSTTSNMVDYDTFLKLLVAEMKNQDPTNPMDSTEYVAQLANFSNVEQGVQINKKLDQLLQFSSISQAGSLIGRTLTSPDGTVTGTIQEVRVFDDGVIAVLDGGEQVVVGGGVTIS
ncbi:MAG: flagellar hook assembly protein FlgD [Notoacmeibacter sp.]|nr:flagellar hook assembly protein FlgD [Notoacmeibacter sp.]